MEQKQTSHKFKKGNSKRILDYLKNNKRLTSMQAIELFGATRLGAYIYALKKEGYQFTTKLVCGKNRWNENCHWVSYELVGEPENND